MGRRFFFYIKVAIIILLYFCFIPEIGISNSLFHTADCSALSVVIPVVVYSNADLEKQAIMKEIKGKSGVYR